MTRDARHRVCSYKWSPTNERAVFRSYACDADSSHETFFATPTRFPPKRDARGGPARAAAMSSGTRWQSELLHCGCATEPDAAEVCLCGCCCHACLYGKTVRALETDRPTVFPPCSCDVDCDQCVSLWFIDVCTLGMLDGLVTWRSRVWLREKHGLDPAPECCGSSFAPHCLCNRAAVVQDYLQVRASLRAKRRAEEHRRAAAASSDAPADDDHHPTAPPLPPELMRR